MAIVFAVAVGIETESLSLFVSKNFNDGLFSLGALNGYLPPLLGKVLYLDVETLLIVLHPLIILLYVRGVHDQKEMVLLELPVDEEVVDDSTFGARMLDMIR